MQVLVRSGIKPFHDEDEFDGYQAAVVRLDPMSDVDALTFMVQRYDHEPPNTLTIFLPEWLETSADIAGALERVLAALHLSPHALIASRGGEAAA